MLQQETELLRGSLLPRASQGRRSFSDWFSLQVCGWPLTLEPGSQTGAVAIPGSPWATAAHSSTSWQSGACQKHRLGLWLAGSPLGRVLSVDTHSSLGTRMQSHGRALPPATLAAVVLAERRLGLPGGSAGLEPAAAGQGVQPSRCPGWLYPGRWLTRVPQGPHSRPPVSVRPRPSLSRCPFGLSSSCGVWFGCLP